MDRSDDENWQRVHGDIPAPAKRVEPGTEQERTCKRQQSLSENEDGDANLSKLKIVAEPGSSGKLGITSESMAAEYMSTRPGLRRSMMTAHSPDMKNNLLHTRRSVRKHATLWPTLWMAPTAFTGLAGSTGLGWLHGLKVVAVAVVAQAVWSMATRLCTDRTRISFAFVAAVIILLTNSSWVQVLTIALGALAGWKLIRAEAPPEKALKCLLGYPTGYRNVATLVRSHVVCLLPANRASSCRRQTGRM